MIHRYNVFYVVVVAAVAAMNIICFLLGLKVLIQMHSPLEINRIEQFFFIFNFYLVQATSADPDYLFTAHNRCLWICHIVLIFILLDHFCNVTLALSLYPFHIHLFTSPETFNK